MIRPSRWDLKLRNAGQFPPGASLTTREAMLEILGLHHQGRDLFGTISPGAVRMGRTGRMGRTRAYAPVSFSPSRLPPSGMCGGV